MEAVFIRFLNVSIIASWLVLAIIILRKLLSKAPKAISVFMWALVGIRLICPFSIKSILSVVPSTETVPDVIVDSQAPTIHSGVPIINSVVNPIISENLAPKAEANVNPMQIITDIACVIWIVGMVAMILYTAISYYRIKRKTEEAVLYLPFERNIWLCDHIDTPFILGIVRPQIYLPSNINEQDVWVVIEHEEAHIKRHDHWWKPLGFLILTIYWFNPILWIAYILLCKDIEHACDEKVLKSMGTEIKKTYSNALINCSVPRKMISACPLAFGEVGAKERVKSILNYKKPAFWAIVVAAVACVVLGAGFLTDPVAKLDNEVEIDAELEKFIEEQIKKHNYYEDKDIKKLSFTDFHVFGANEDEENTTVYMWFSYSEYGDDDTRVRHLGTDYGPAAVTVKKIPSSGKYELVEYWEASWGDYYTEGMKNKFPKSLLDDVRDFNRDIEGNRYKTAEEYFAIDKLKYTGYGLGENGQQTLLWQHDEWGLTMDLIFKSATEFDIVFNHNSKETAAIGSLMVSPQYEIRAIYNGKIISLESYIRDVLGMDYTEPELSWDDVIYDIKLDGETVIEENFLETYGELPVGQYVICKNVRFVSESADVYRVKCYTVEFAVTD